MPHHAALEQLYYLVLQRTMLPRPSKSKNEKYQTFGTEAEKCSQSLHEHLNQRVLINALVVVITCACVCVCLSFFLSSVPL